MDKNIALTEFEKLTDDILAIDIRSNIDEVLIIIEEKLKRRDEIIKQIDELDDEKLFSEEDLSRILQKNNMLETKFEEITLSISDSIKEVVNEKSLSSTKKKAHRSYSNVQRQNDGYFIDKKK